MTKVICISSAKGGVGKTMLTANLGLALAQAKKNVVILDANLSTPNLALHLGIPLYPTTLHDVIKGNASIHDATYEHESGLKVIPAGLSVKDLKGAEPRHLSGAVLDLLGNAEIVILDSSAGLGVEATSAIESSDEMILVVNPDLPSVIDALKAVRIAQELGTKIKGVVINRVAKNWHEMTRSEILGILGDVEVLAEIPEDIRVQRAIARRIPVVSRYPNSKASKHIKKLAADIIGEEYEIKKPWHEKIFGWMK